jgi:hypothetical protein
MNSHPIRKLLLGLAFMLAARSLCSAGAAVPDTYQPFEGDKSSWHDGYDRYNYLMDEETLDVEPFQRAEDEKFGIKDHCC